MSEFKRIQELYKYRLLDTAPEKELDELAELASAICDTPISLVSLIDTERQWFKAVKGLHLKQTPRQDSFCQHVLHNPQEVLVVDDPQHDDRFRDNPLVTGNPHIRFYAGAPLRTPDGNILGTLCIMDNKARELSESQKNALRLLAKKAMQYLNTRKLLLEQEETIEFGIARLKKLSDEAPGAIYQLEMKPDGTMSFPFISKGFTIIHPNLHLHELKEDASIAFSVVHPDDLEFVKSSLYTSYKNLSRWNIEFRLKSDDGKTIWHWTNANPELKADGTVVWFGTFQDVTAKKEYQNTLEKIVFDISHVMRRPVANMLGLTAAITKQNLDATKLQECVTRLKIVSEELDGYMKRLNTDYATLKSNAAGNSESTTSTNTR